MNADEKMAILRRAIEAGAFERAKVRDEGFFWKPGTRTRSADHEDDDARVLRALEQAERILGAPVTGNLALRFIGALVYDRRLPRHDSRGTNSLVRLGRCRAPRTLARPRC